MLKIKTIIILSVLAVFMSCGGGQSAKNETESTTEQTSEVTNEPVEKSTEPVDFMADKGVGPITSITLDAIDEGLVEKGKEVFKANCTACHKIGKRFVGPALHGITERRSPEWIMNMILNPEVMIVENEAAKQLLAEYSAPMANQGLTEEEARALLEMFRTQN